MRNRYDKVETKGRFAWVLGALACLLAAPVWAQEALTVEALQQRLEALERRIGGNLPVVVEGKAPEPGLAGLDQRLRILERKLELQQEEQVAKAREAPVVAVNHKGASFKSANGDYEVKIRGLIQSVKAFEELTIEAAVTGDYSTALMALSVHPLMPSVDIAEKILNEYLVVNRPFLPQYPQ